MADSQALDTVSSSVLAPAGLDETHLQTVLHSIMQRNVDSAELYFQLTRNESWALEDGIVKDGSFSHDQGVGVRAISGEKTGFAYSDELLLPALNSAADAARAIVRQNSDGRVQAWRKRFVTPLYPATDPTDSLSDEAKTQFMRHIDEATRALDPRVEQVFVNLSGSYDLILVAASDGTYCADVRPLVRMSVSVIVAEGDRRESGYSGGGGRMDMNELVSGDFGLGYAKEAVRQALVQLDAVAAPAGSIPVVLGPGWPGVLLHEAVGHGLEGDFNRKGTSAFAGRIGQRVAGPLCTVVDDGTIAGRRGSLSVDDEGTPTSCTTLIENGVLSAYMQDKLNAGLMGMEATGNGRRQSFAHLPMPRMTNTYMLAGPHDPAEIIESVDYGLYAPNFAGGQVDITSGKFVFSASEAYLIEKGRITAPVKGATLIGNGPDVMTRISMVGTDLELDSGIGVCGKEGQSVPVGVGQPTVKIDELTVGGTQ